MAANNRQLHLIQLKLQMLMEEKHLLTETLEAYINSIVRNGQVYSETVDKAGLSFTDTSNSIENAIFFLGELTSMVRSRCDPGAHSLDKLTLASGESMYESSALVSFEVLQKATSTFNEPQQLVIKPVECSHSQLEDSQIKACHTKLDTLSSTMVKVIGDLNSLKKQHDSLSSCRETTGESLSLEDNEKFVEMKKNFYSMSEDLEGYSKQMDRINKDFLAVRMENQEKLSSQDARLVNLEARVTTMETDLKNKLSSMEKEWTKLGTNSNTLERRVNQSENCFNDLDHRLSKLQDRTTFVIEEKEKQMATMGDQLEKISQELGALKEEGVGKMEKSLMDMLLTINNLEVWVREDLQQKVVKLAEPVKKLEGLKVDKELEELRSLLSNVLSSQTLQGGKIKALEKKLKPKALTFLQQFHMMKVGTRVKKGPNWTNNSAEKISLNGHGTIVFEMPAFKQLQVQWDCGIRTNCMMDPERNFFELQLADME